ncbi:MAG: nucleotidyltransferase domain-containing protein [bacterium]|nr:nucleotidyltransferase domain-containing protein [bacterium]
MLETAVKVIRKVIETNGLEIVKIILFGSMARGDYNQGSDWDFLNKNSIGCISFFAHKEGVEI